MNLLYRLLRWGHRFPSFLLPSPFAVALHSWGRRVLWSWITHCHIPVLPFTPPPSGERHCWGLRFRSPLFNAAGVFKYGEGYELSYWHGSGAYLLGTITALPRRGIKRWGIRQPFLSLPRSCAALNTLGLPNPGHHAAARIVERLPRYPGFPIGVSVALDPELKLSEALQRLLEGLRLYSAAGVDFIELNESCPNIPHDPSWRALEFRLRWIAEHFLSRRERSLPVVVKISTDTPVEVLPALLELLLQLGYDGITIGNTSTAYEALLPTIAPSERHLYTWFWHRFGGGISGAPLAHRRRQLISLSAQWIARHATAREFHLLAVGGIMNPTDLREVLSAGASLAQWYTGYLHALATHGDAVYRWMSSSCCAHP